MFAAVLAPFCSWYYYGESIDYTYDVTYNPINVCAFTSKAEYADTTNGVSVRLESYGGWSDAVDLFKSGTDKGVKHCATIHHSSWPTEMLLEIDGNNAWGFWKITIDGCEVTSDPSGKSGTAYADNGWWLDGNEDAPAALTLAVPQYCYSR